MRQTLTSVNPNPNHNQDENDLVVRTQLHPSLYCVLGQDSLPTSPRTNASECWWLERLFIAAMLLSAVKENTRVHIWMEYAVFRFQVGHWVLDGGSYIPLLLTTVKYIQYPTANKMIRQFPYVTLSFKKMKKWMDERMFCFHRTCPVSSYHIRISLPG